MSGGGAARSPKSARRDLPAAASTAPRIVLACSSSADAARDVAAAAAGKLAGPPRAVFDPEGTSGVTHLVLEAPRRTVKVLHALARGAWVLKPEWLYASVEAGGWVREDSFEWGPEDLPGARAARLARVHGDLGVMSGRVVFVEMDVSPPKATLEALVRASSGDVRGCAGTPPPAR